MANYKIIHDLDIESMEPGVHHFFMDLVANGIGQDIHVPVMVAKGTEPGPCMGVTAVVHGNELNGLRVVQQLMQKVDWQELKGTVVGVPVVNVPAILNQQRRFNDDEDLNRIMPGREDGNMSDVYAARVMNRIIAKFDYLIDLHTASFGRINSFYIRANMKNDVQRKMAELQNADIILNNEGADGTLRSAASDLGIHAITLEVGDPNRFQKGMIRSGIEGVFNVLRHLQMIKGAVEQADEEAVFCGSSYWLYADRGGILEVYPDITEVVRKGEKVATIRDVFGAVVREYFCPEDGIVIGKSTHPVGQTGSRILHLGIIENE
ncbi:succinylglutamate desuccinylase/aspartoacylase family protein [Sanyastnella coralliicola]|uniref:succinylglutamate desuccinylase/aspartoacylase family protein n=1 Tax=Sanyastnella coralliicola TaxID=3069118 RepID=UPI0027BB1228|nr:succinylglutamate desuccinylase/aspartoacylase family protein [Longitalea sp. SCSIO 12813]